jgi:hypothetical protein
MVECPQRSLALAAHKTAAQPSRCFETMIIIHSSFRLGPNPANERHYNLRPSYESCNRQLIGLVHVALRETWPSVVHFAVRSSRNWHGRLSSSCCYPLDVCFFCFVSGGNRDQGNRKLANSDEVRKRHFLPTFYIKMIILPRQARDKHRENS